MLQNFLLIYGSSGAYRSMDHNIFDEPFAPVPENIEEFLFSSFYSI